MCLSCGCNKAWDTHDGYGHISLQDVLNAAKCEGLDPDTVVNNIENTYAAFVDHDFNDVDDVPESYEGMEDSD